MDDDDYQNFDDEHHLKSENLKFTSENKGINFSESSIQKNTDEQFLSDAISFINNNDIREKSYHCKKCKEFPLLKLEDDSKVSIKCQCGSIETDLDGIKNYIIRIEKDELQKIFRCQKPEHENQPYSSFCNICKNLCEKCLQSHNIQGNRVEHKIYSFEEEDEKIKKEKSSIDKFFDEYNINEKTEKKTQTILNMNNSLVLRQEKKIDYLKYIKVKQLYDVICDCKRQFPHYNHYLNIREINYYLLDKLEIHYKYLNEMDKIEIRPIINIFGKKFVENNKDKCYLIIKGKELQLNDQYQLEKDQSELIIYLVQEKPIENMSEMFSECHCLSSLTFNKQWLMSKITDMSSMFFECNNLKHFNGSYLDTSEVENFSKMFYNCKSLKDKDLNVDFNTERAKNLRAMFYGCELLEKKLEGISKWVTINVIDMSFMFAECKKLKDLSDLSSFITGNVNFMNNMFQNCSNLEEIKGLSKWDTKEVIFMNDMFQNCRNIKTFVDIFKWETKDVQSFNEMFDGCNREIEKPPWYPENQ